MIHHINPLIILGPILLAFILLAWLSGRQAKKEKAARLARRASMTPDEIQADIALEEQERLEFEDEMRIW